MLPPTNSAHGNLLMICGVGFHLYAACGTPILDVLCANLLPTFCKIWLEFKHGLDRLARLLGRIGEQEAFLHCIWCCSNIYLADWRRKSRWGGEFSTLVCDILTREGRKLTQILLKWGVGAGLAEITANQRISSCTLMSLWSLCKRSPSDLHYLLAKHTS